MFLPQNERPSFTPIQHKWQNYSLYILEMGRQKILDWMIATTPCI
jgi:hypothetical protein